MRIQVEFTQDGRTVKARAEQCSPAMPPARVAAALAAAVETALQTPRSAPLAPAPADLAPRELAPVEPPPVRAVPVEPASISPASIEPARVATAPIAEIPAPRVGDGAIRSDDGEVRRRALRLLDDGRTDAQVCAELGISLGRLLRWDDDAALDAEVDQFVEAGSAR